MAESKRALARTKNYAVATDRAPGTRWVTMTNALTRAGHGLTLSEKRLVMLGVSKLDSARAVAPGDVPTTRITAIEFAEAFGVDPTTAYEQLKSAAQHLYQRSISFFEPAHKRPKATTRGKAATITIGVMRWVGQVHYQQGEGWVELYWWPKLVPHLVGLRRQFTSYQLQQASALRSVYSWRLLELLMRFKDKGYAEYTIEDFCISMDATASQRSDFAKVRSKIIEPAIKELREKDGMAVEWHTIKRGRKVAAVCFTFEPHRQASLDL